MKVLLVDQFGKTTGDITLALAELINQDSSIETEVYISDNTQIQDDRHYTIKIIKGFHDTYVGSLVNKAKNYLKGLKELKSYIDANDFDIIHLQWFSLPWIEWMYVAELAKMHKVVITVHDVVPFDNRPLEIKALDKIYSYANHLLVHTESAKNKFLEMYNATTQISVVSQSFYLKSNYKRVDNKVAKNHFNIPDDCVVFLYYGTIRPSKGLDILIKAISEAHKKNNKIYLLAAGAFHKVKEEDYVNLVKQYLSQKFSTVNFGFVPQEEEQWYFSAADVLCLPYLEITQSAVAQLGLMYELPIIATDIGEMSDVCRNNINGLLIEEQNIDALANAIINISGDENFRNNASMESKKLGEREFSLITKSENVISVYKNLFDKKKG